MISAQSPSKCVMVFLFYSPYANNLSLPSSLHSFPFFFWPYFRKPKSRIFTVGFGDLKENIDNQEELLLRDAGFTEHLAQEPQIGIVLD